MSRHATPHSPRPSLAMAPARDQRRHTQAEYRRQLDEERAAKLARGTNKEGGKKSKKDKKVRASRRLVELAWIERALGC